MSAKLTLLGASSSGRPSDVTAMRAAAPREWGRDRALMGPGVHPSDLHRRTLGSGYTPKGDTHRHPVCRGPVFPLVKGPVAGVGFRCTR